MSAHTKRWVLIVAVSHYQDPDLRLDGVMGDAERFREILRKHADGGVHRFKLLCNRAATKTAILDMLEKIARQASTTDQVVVYFAGHGHRVPGPDGYDYFLLPYEATFADARIAGLSPLDLSGALRRGDAQAEEFIFILDSCHSGGIAGDLCEKGDFLELRDNWHNLCIGAAARSHHLAGEEDRGGFFTQALCDALSGHGELYDSEGRISVQSAFDWAARQAEARAQSLGHRQTCVTAGISRPLFLTKVEVAPPRPPLIVHPLRPARDYQHRRELETLEQFWRDGQRGGVVGLIGIGGTGKTALAQRFLNELPDSTVDSDDVPKREQLPSPDHLFVWSFYESPHAGQHSEDRRLDPALRQELQTDMTRDHRRFLEMVEPGIP